jgi:glycosyltransferase involved in cell wall biosynthesis
MQVRQQLGFREEDIVCIYSGRFSPGKNPQCLARAIEQLHQRDPRFRGLFVGSGTTEEVAQILCCRGCAVHPFVEYRLLPDFYRAADIGVWPRQESTSQLDAAACGLPLILSNRVKVVERVQGNGFLYAENDATDLARQLIRLELSETRRALGQIGADKVRTQFSWDRIATLRLADYQAALHRADNGSDRRVLA